MGLKGIWTITCDQCGLFVTTEKTPEGEIGNNGTGIATSYLDIWGAGIPDGWLQIPYDEVTKKHYLFFHISDCYKEWLRLQGRLKELEEFNNAVWIA